MAHLSLMAQLTSGFDRNTRKHYTYITDLITNG